MPADLHAAAEAAAVMATEAAAMARTGGQEDTSGGTGRINFIMPNVATVV
jgi:hypothetical protein